MGPNYSISTACATANYAFVAAANHLRSGDCDVMVVSTAEYTLSIDAGCQSYVTVSVA